MFRPRLRAAGLVLYALTFASAHVLAQDLSTPAGSGLAADLIVNGQVISENHVRLMATGFSTDRSGHPLQGVNARDAARTELVTEEVLAQEARRAGLDRNAAVEDQLAFQQREILSRAYLEHYFEGNPVTDASLKASYEFARANGKIVEYHVRHILVASPAEAQEVIAKLNRGENFAALAHHFTQDPGGQNNDGDLGWFRPDIFVDHYFADAVTSLKKGEYTHAPVRTRFGWHVIKVEEGPRPVANVQPYDALDDTVKQALRQRVAQERIEALTARLTASARITGPGAGHLKEGP